MELFNAIAPKGTLVKVRREDGSVFQGITDSNAFMMFGEAIVFIAGENDEFSKSYPVRRITLFVKREVA